MSYRCGACGGIVPPGKARLTFRVERAVPKVVTDPRLTIPVRSLDAYGRPAVRREIASEIPVCERCHHQLRVGVSLATLIAEHVPPAELPPSVAEAAFPELAADVPPPTRRLR